MRLFGTIVLLLSLGFYGCDGGGGGAKTDATQQADIGETLATVNGTPIGSVAFSDLASRQMPANGSALTVEERKELLQQLVDEELVYQEAIRRGIDKDPKVKRVIVSTLLRDEVYANIRNSDFTDAELEAYYEAHKDEFVVPEKVQIKRILIRVTDDRPDDAAKAEAERIRGQLSGDLEKFKDLAAEFSEDPYKRRGGDLGFVAREGKPGLDQAIVDKAFAMEVNQLSEVFKSTDGYNILLVANKRERLERTFQQMKGAVLRKVKNDKLRDVHESYVNGLKQGADVKINEDQLATVEIKAAKRPTIGSPGLTLNPGVGPADGMLPGIEGGEGAEGGEAGEGGEEEKGE